MSVKGEDISLRFVTIATETIRLIKKLPSNYKGLHFGKQLTRSSTSCGANYEEARAAESDADFIHKLKICLKEIRESIYWLKVVDGAEIIKDSYISRIIAEFTELSNMIASSIITVQKKKKEVNKIEK